MDTTEFYKKLVVICRTKDIPPTVREIAAVCDRSAPTIQQHLDKLEELKLIKRDKNKARSIRVV